MTNDILVFAEIRGDGFKRVNAELVTAAGSLASKSSSEVHIAVLGNNIDGAIEEARSLVSGKVFAVRSPVLDRYSTQGYASGLEAVVKQVDPSIVLFGATAMGKDLSPRIAARLNGSLATDCTELDIDGGSLKVKRPVYSGKAYAEVTSAKDTIKIASVRPNVFAPAQKTGEMAEVVGVDLPITLNEIAAVVKEVVGGTSGRKDVTEAEVIVAGGRALKTEENFKILEELADVIGGSVGASRAAVDAGYAQHSRQVGQTGKVVNPKLYIAVGISGAIQHLVGMRTSKVIVAINKDASAPIFRYSDYGIVGDLFEVVPLLTQEFKRLLEAS